LRSSVKSYDNTDPEENMKSLLLLEEDSERRETLSKMLRSRGFRVFPSEHEAAALTVLDSDHSVDLVIAGTTHRNRLEFLADLRERQHTVPVVFLADHCDAESRLRALAGSFYLFRRHNFYINMRTIEFSELDRLIRIVLNPQRIGRVAGFRAA
jgi:CheY-like chemotaxis protein